MQVPDLDKLLALLAESKREHEHCDDCGTRRQPRHHPAARHASGVPPPEDELRVGIASHGEGSDVYEGAALRLAQVRRHHPLGNGAVRQHDLRAEVIS